MSQTHTQAVTNYEKLLLRFIYDHPEQAHVFRIWASIKSTQGVPLYLRKPQEKVAATLASLQARGYVTSDKPRSRRHYNLAPLGLEAIGKAGEL